MSAASRPDDLAFLTIAEASELIRTRKLSPVELTQVLLERIGRLDNRVSAFITVTGDLALQQARTAEAEIARGHYRGALHGIPFGLKDIYETKGIRTTAHSRIYADNVPQEDAATVERLASGGAVLLGKLATHEFAIGGPSHDLPWPVPRNPWHPDHYVGGSSSGSAAAVAAGFVPGALGSDTGASIRNPAALAGIAGFKPTYGLVSRRGVIANSQTFDHCGPMARTVEDCAILLQAIAGHDARDPASACVALPDYRAALTRELHGVRVGVIRHFWEEDLPAGAEMCRAMNAALDVLAELGATLEDVRVRPMRDYHDVRMVIAQTEVFCNHQQDLIARPFDFGAELIRKVVPACLFQAADYVQAQRERRRMLAEFEAVYARYDVLVTAASGPAPRLDAVDGMDFWTKPSIYNVFNVSGGPALAVCAGFSAAALPIGMQIGAAPFRDEVVLRVGHAYERATPWHLSHPRLEGGARPAPIALRAVEEPALDASTREAVERAVLRAGLAPGCRERALLMEVAPYAIAMAQRIPRDYSRMEDPPFRLSLPDC